MRKNRYCNNASIYTEWLKLVYNKINIKKLFSYLIKLYYRVWNKSWKFIMVK